MNELRQEYLARTDGDQTAAATELAFDLMQGDPATFKAGYSFENAAIAANEVFRKVPRFVILERLSEKLGGRQAL